MTLVMPHRAGPSSASEHREPQPRRLKRTVATDEVPILADTARRIRGFEHVEGSIWELLICSVEALRSARSIQREESDMSAR